MLAQAFGREARHPGARRRRHRRLAVRRRRLPRARPHLPPRRAGARRPVARPPRPRRARASWSSSPSASPPLFVAYMLWAVTRLHLRELEVQGSRAGPDQGADLDPAADASSSAWLIFFVAVLDELVLVIEKQKPAYQVAEEERRASGDFSEIGLMTPLDGGPASCFGSAAGAADRRRLDRHRARRAWRGSACSSSPPRRPT